MPWILSCFTIIPLNIEIYLDMNLETLLQQYLESAIQIMLDQSTISWARFSVLSLHNTLHSLDPLLFLPSIEPILIAWSYIFVYTFETLKLNSFMSVELTYHPILFGVALCSS